MRAIFRSLGIIVMVFTAAGVFAGCAQGWLSTGPILPPPPPVAAPEDMKILVAKVNGAGITRYSLIGVTNSIAAMNERASAFESREKTGKIALERLIFEELAFQEAKRRGLSLGVGDLDRAMGTLRAKLGDEGAYKDFLSKQGFSEEGLRSQVERGLLLRLIIGQEVIDKTSISDETVRKEYEREKDRLIVPGKATVEDVVFFLNPDDAASMAKANEILAAINAGKDKDPANLAVDGSFIVQRIDLDREKAPALYDAARKLKEGELSGVVKTSDSLHIIRLVEYVPEKQKSYEEVKGPLEAKLKTAAQKKRRQAWERELRKDAKIEILGPEGWKTY